MVVTGFFAQCRYQMNTVKQLSSMSDLQYIICVESLLEIEFKYKYEV